MSCDISEMRKGLERVGGAYHDLLRSSLKAKQNAGVYPAGGGAHHARI